MPMMTAGKAPWAVLVVAALAACGAPPDQAAAVDAAAADDDAAATVDAACAPDGCPPPSCADLQATGACPEHRVCEDTAQGGACREACDPDYRFDAATGLCAPCELPGCAPPPTCAPEVPGSIAAQCEAEHRACADGACGACLDGYRVEPPEPACVRDCTATQCAAGHHPERQGDTCACIENTCPPGEAQVQGVEPFRCTGAAGVPACELTCLVQNGEVDVYPVTAADGECVCRTAPGYYWSSTHHAARRCDNDGDGWINRSAWAAYEAEDPTVRAIAEAGCGLARADRISLVNEYGQEQTLYVCATGLATAPCQASDGGSSWLPLVEPDGNDSQQVVDATPAVTPAVGSRRLLARELNAVTKACTTRTADYDGDTRADVAQSQEPRASANRADRWSQVAYFVELHTGVFVPPGPEEAAGRFVITERSRCDAGFPMGYAEGADPWWRECSRQRDARWIEGLDEPGFDFARWTERGDPVVAPPPIAASPSPGEPTAPHGLCSAATPWSGPWRGMTHHSQFKCVVIDDAATAPSFAQPTAAFATQDGFLDFQECAAEPEVPGAPPAFRCAPAPAVAPEVGWAAVRYRTTPVAPGQPPLNEVAACVDETMWRASTPSLCPADTPTLPDGLPEQVADPARFGELLCACDPRHPTHSPLLDDPVDDAFFDRNCDGVDGEADRMIFVAADGADAPGCGTREAPCRTIGRGLELATPARPIVAVSEGVYAERVVLRDGVAVHGGYSRANGWARGDGYVSRIEGAAALQQAEGTQYVESVVATNLASATLDRFTIHTAARPDRPGASVYGVRVVSSQVTLRHLVITTGAGTAGSPGGAGATGANGQTGNAASGRIGGWAKSNPACDDSTSRSAAGGRGGTDGVSWACGTGSSGGGGDGGDTCKPGGNGGGSPSCGSGGRDGGTGGSCDLAANGTPLLVATGAGSVVGAVWRGDTGAGGGNSG
ncbi:MAG TPA: hypothetical protein VM734_34105, partial [Kofleriaceae bacterium]|nr:hypothetical protein [Kofleriaceae bacterium]